MIPAILGLAATICAVAAWRWRTAWRSGRADAIIVALALPALVSIVLLAAASIVHMLSDMWSFIRLAPSVSLLRGYALYYPEGEGPLVGWSYGPMAPLLQLPAAAFPGPISAVVAAGMINEAMLLVPLLVFCWQALPASPSGRATGVLILAALQAALMHVDASLYWLQQIQVDAFAMGLALLALATIACADPALPVSRRRLWISALFFGAAVFSKQNELCVLPVAVAYLWARDGARSSVQWVLAAAVAGGVGFLALVATCGWQAVFLNMWLVPTHHPLGQPGVQGIAEVGGRFLEQLSVFFAVALSMVLALFKFGPRRPTWRQWLQSSPWILPAAGAVLMLPISIMGGVKIGGDNNSNHSLYYLAAAVALLAAGLASVDRPAFRLGVALVAAVATLGSVLALAAQSHPPTLNPRESLLEREWRFSKAHPEEVWFGANPLVTLYTDGKMYHQGYGVYDRTLPNLPPPRTQLEKHLPSRLKWVSTPGSPFWVPDGLQPILPPAELSELKWYERASSR
jgi:hypothetical protein